jgi:hypothetical protein
MRQSRRPHRRPRRPRPRRSRVNWRWMLHRARMAFRCRHAWREGCRDMSAQACEKCGTWRWFPLTPGG